MRRLFYYLLFLSIAFNFSMASAENFEVKNIGVWPGFDNPRAIATDTSRQLFFWATGDLIGIYDFDTTHIGHVRISTQSGVKGLAYDQDTRTLHVAGGEGGFVTVDVADPSNPKIISVITENANNPGYVMGAELKKISAYAIKYTTGTGTTAGRRFVFLADKNFGLRVYDVTDPTVPFEYGFYRQDSPYESKTTGGYINIDTMIYSSKLYAFVLDSYYGLRIFDATNPAKILKPVSKDLREFYYNSMSLVKDLAVSIYSGKFYCFVTGPNSSSSQAAVVKYEVIINPESSDSETTNIKEIKNIGRCDALAMGRGMALKGNYAYIADNDKGVRVVDIANSTGLTDSGLEIYSIKASISDSAAGTYSVFVSGNTLYSANLKKGLRVYDITNPESPSDSGYDPIYLINTKALDVGQFQIENPAQTKFENRTFSFMVSEGKAPAFYVFDVTATDAVTLEAVKPLSGTPTSVKISNDFAYVTAGSEGLYIIYIGNPRQPGEPLRVDTQGFANDVALNGGYAFVADGTSGLAVIDARNPSNPSQSVSYPLAGYEFKGIYIKDNYAYIASGSKGLVISDITNPSSPVLPVSTVDTPGDSVAVYAKGGNAYIADGSAGLQVVDVRTPQRPGLPYQIGVNGVATDVFAEGRYVFVSKGANGYAVVNAENPSTATVIMNYASYGSMTGLWGYFNSSDNSIVVHASDGTGINNISRFAIKDVTPPAPLNPDSPESACFIKSSSEYMHDIHEKISNALSFLKDF